MDSLTAENLDSGLAVEELEELIGNALSGFSEVARVLLLHPDYSRHDFTNVIAPRIYSALRKKGLRQLDTLNAAGTHRAMSEPELCAKLGMNKASHPLIGVMNNHHFDNPDSLFHAADIPAEVVSDKTGGHLNMPLAVTANKILKRGYDLIIAVSGTVPHEAAGYSGGTKIFFPGVSGPEVTGLFHWAAVLIGIPTIIGQLHNPARQVVDLGTKLIFEALQSVPVVSFNMVYSEDKDHAVVPRGLYSGLGLIGFAEALEKAAALSARLHIVTIDEPKNVVVQRLPSMYDEVWTAGKGSYKLQRPGVMAEGGEIILLAPHITCFHSNPKMEKALRQIGYHGRDYVLEYLRKNPDFDRNAASHVINLRGIGRLENGQEIFPFKVTLATAIPEETCRQMGLGYRHPESLREQDFQGPGKLWISEGGQWLYDRA